jgi:hypothetical protein
MLQRAREDDTLIPSLRLTQAAIGPVVLDPLNFFRYNDGLIQAALLRCASPAELDYTCHMDLSKQITELIIKMINCVEDEFGEALIEFLLALASSRLSVLPEQKAVLITTLKNKAQQLKGKPMGKVLKVFASACASSAP